MLLQDRLAPVFVVTNGARLTPWGRQAQGLLARFGHEVDFARLDGMSAADMVKGGRFTLDSIEQGFREGSLQDFILIPISDTYKPLISQGRWHVSQPTTCGTLKINPPMLFKLGGCASQNYEVHSVICECIIPVRTLRDMGHADPNSDHDLEK